MADEKTTYQVISPLRHNGKLYTPVEGNVVEVSLTEDEATALLTMKIVGPMPAKAEEQTSQASGQGGKKK